MLQSRLFWKLFLGFAVVNLLTAAALVSATLAWQKGEAAELVERELETAAALLDDAATAWVLSPSDAAEQRLQALAEKADLTLTVSSDAGAERTLGATPPDGAAPPTIHARRVLTADGKVIGELDVTRPDNTLVATLAKLWRRYTQYAVLLIALTTAAGFAVVYHLVGPVRALDRAARAMAAGNYRQRAFVSNRDELGVLAQSFNQMSEDLGRQLEDLRERDRRQATVLGGMIEGVIAIDSRRHVLFANNAAGKLFDFFPPQAEGRPLVDSVRNHVLHQAATSSIESQSPQRLEINWGERVLSVQITPLASDQSTGAVLVLHDTTELRRLENLRRDFVANVSHELKTPLSAIKANAETLLRGAVDDKANRMRFLQGIDDQSDRLADLIQDMLSLARIESAQQPFAIHAVPVAATVAACVKEYEQRAEAKEVALSAVGNPNASEVQVKADPEGLRVILSNLIDNAIKYTPTGGSVQISWEVSSEQQTLADSAAQGAAKSVRIEVADTGVGIPEEKQPRVFERFFRVDEARSRELGGTGLGLSIVKHLAQSFGGGVSVESRRDQGARFIVTLPAG